MKYKVGDNVFFNVDDKIFYGEINDVNDFLGYSIRSLDFPFGIYVEENDIIKKEIDGVNKNNNPYEIVDYKIFNNKAVVFTFADGTEERAVCDPKDKFDLERAVEVGIVKKKLGGSNAYNTLVKRAMNQIKAVDKRKAAEKAEEELKAHRRQKDIERKINRKEKKRLEQIEIQKEAFLKAMMEYDECVANTQTETLS